MFLVMYFTVASHRRVWPLVIAMHEEMDGLSVGDNVRTAL